MSNATNVELIGAGLRFGAVGLIVGSFLLFAMGVSGALGGSFRMAIEPALRSARERTSLSREELADASTMLAAAFAAGAFLTEMSPLAGVIAIGLWLARPTIRRATREENKMLAIGGLFSIDLIIGVYTPIMLAQFLVANVMLGLSFLSVVVALSWPAGGGGIPGRRWQLAPVAAN